MHEDSSLEQGSYMFASQEDTSTTVVVENQAYRVEGVQFNREPYVCMYVYNADIITDMHMTLPIVSGHVGI